MRTLIVDDEPAARRRLVEADRRAPTREALRSVASRLPVPRKPRLLVRSGRGHRLLPLAEIRRFSARQGLVAVRRELEG